MSISGYSSLRILLHWLSAAVILWVLVSGFYVACIEVPTAIKASIAAFNVSLATVFIPFFAWRVALALRDAHVRRLKVRGRIEVIARLAHVSIYLVVGVVLASGVLMMDRPVSLFAWRQFGPLLSDPAWIARFLALHVQACLFLSVLLMLHIGAVIFHQVRGEPVLPRMGWRLRSRAPHIRHT